MIAGVVAALVVLGALALVGPLTNYGGTMREGLWEFYLGCMVVAPCSAFVAVAWLLR